MAQRTLADIRADYYHPGYSQEQAQQWPGGRWSLVQVYQVGWMTPTRILPENLGRKRMIIENRSSTDSIFIGPANSINSSLGTGLLLRPGETLIDDPPFVHVGEVWAVASAGATVTVAVMEVT